MKHTEGPWKSHSFTVQGPKGQIIADVCVEQPPHAIKIKPSEFEANARLIAAAPDAHEILTALREWYSDGTSTGPVKHALFDADRTWEKVIKEYFAKATGK